MFVDLTQEEQAKVDALISEYEAIRAELKPLTTWERQREGEPMPPEVAAAHDRLSKAADAYMIQHNAIIEAAEDRHMQSLDQSPADILEDGKARARAFAAEQYKKRTKDPADLDMLRGVLDELLKRHYEALEGYPVQLTDLKKHAGDVLKIIPTDQVNPWAVKTGSFMVTADLMTRDMFSNPRIETGTEYELTTIKKSKHRQEVNSILQVDIDGLGPGVKIHGKYIKKIDEPVLMAFLSLAVKDNYSVITERMIHEKLTNSPGAGMTPKQAAGHRESLARLEACTMAIDATKEIQAYKPEIEQYKRSGRLLPVEHVDVKMGGHEVRGRQLMHLPVWYRYAALKKQISTIPGVMLLTPGQNTEEKRLIQYYLIQRVEGTRLGNLTPVILYETLYKQVEIPQKTEGAIRKKQFKIRETAKEILTYWIEIKRIQGFTERKRGRGYDAIVLDV